MKVDSLLCIPKLAIVFMILLDLTQFHGYLYHLPESCLPFL